ncbi:hypothetical protein H2201_006903 [Coniosporium apollinis]|uniref:5'-hydroxyaverantin dehydrogenase n=1 Tax=Coniosporium apollinis TaxID=61459 RepID=A0ABQ9NP22_9PEZI|nr:hypothetical protein H2201_006903 [Coniosporium apollinis]
MEPITTTTDLSALKGKSILITGGASGIGLATARAWAAAGAYVTIADIQAIENGEKIAQELNDQGGHVKYVYCDVTSWESQIQAFKTAIMFAPYHTLDIVATFAGTAFMPGNQVDHVLAAGEPTLEKDPNPPNIKNFEVNLIGLYYSSWLALYYFRLKPSGAALNGSANGTANGAGSRVTKSLILVSSIGGYMDSPKASTYPASKFGVRGLFRSTRARTMDLGVRCNLIAPWFMDTPLIGGIKAAMASRGIDMAKALSFARIELAVEAANECAVNGSLHGRALAVMPEGIFDLKEDLEDGWAGDQLKPIMKRRREAGFDA